MSLIPGELAACIKKWGTCVLTIYGNEAVVLLHLPEMTEFLML